jgi:hypothetical protein
MRMNLKQIKTSTVSLFVCGLLMLLVGTYTENGGFQLAGAMLAVICLILAVSQAAGRNGTD